MAIVVVRASKIDKGMTYEPTLILYLMRVGILEGESLPEFPTFRECWTQRDGYHYAEVHRFGQISGLAR